MNRRFVAYGRALTGAALLLVMITTNGAAQQAATQPGLSVARVGERTIVQLTSDTPVRASLSEPFVLEDRTRIYLVLEGAADTVAAPSTESVAEAGLLTIEPEQRAGSLRIAVEAASISEYGIVQHETGAALWLQQTPAASSTTSPFPAVATQVSRPMSQPAGLSLLERTRSSASTFGQRIARAVATGAAGVADGALSAAAKLRPITLELAAGTLLLLLPIAAWRIVAMRRGQAASGPDAPRNERNDATHRPDARKQDARLWAAKTLAQQGAQPAEIAERTGLSRDAAALLALTLDAAKAAAPGKTFRPALTGGAVAGGEPVGVTR